MGVDLKTDIIIQARMTSTRLPGKILKTIQGKPLLSYQIDRLKKVQNINDIIIATTENQEDDILVDFCHKHSLKFYRGSENNVLERYFKTALKYKSDIICRITSDCPVIDPEVSTNTISLLQNHLSQLDYVANFNGSIKRTFPRGLDTEVFTFKALKKTYQEASEPPDLEHVTSYIYRHPKKFRLGFFHNDNDYSHYRLTVDTKEDLDLATKIISNLYPKKPNFNLSDMVELLKKHPDWEKINQSVEQKKYGE